MISIVRYLFELSPNMTHKLKTAANEYDKASRVSGASSETIRKSYLMRNRAYNLAEKNQILNTPEKRSSISYPAFVAAKKSVTSEYQKATRQLYPNRGD